MLILALILALALASSAGATTANGPCSMDPGLSPDLPCSETFTATGEHQRYKAMGRGWHRDWINTRWTAANGKQFVALGSDPDACKDFGRYRELRVREDYCDGRYVVEFWSVGESAVVTFSWGRQADLAAP